MGGVGDAERSPLGINLPAEAFLVEQAVYESCCSDALSTVDGVDFGAWVELKIAHERLNIETPYKVQCQERNQGTSSTRLSTIWHTVPPYPLNTSHPIHPSVHSHQLVTLPLRTNHPLQPNESNR